VSTMPKDVAILSASQLTCDKPFQENPGFYLVFLRSEVSLGRKIADFTRQISANFDKRQALVEKYFYKKRVDFFENFT